MQTASVCVRSIRREEVEGGGAPPKSEGRRRIPVQGLREAGKLSSLSPPDTFAEYPNMRRSRVGDADASLAIMVSREDAKMMQNANYALVIDQTSTQLWHCRGRLFQTA